MRLASRLLRIQKGEGRVAGLVVGLAFVAMTSFTVGESGINALFFDRVGVQALPIMYLLQGGASFVVMLALTGTLGRLGPRRAYLSTPLALGAVLLTERALILTNVRWIYFVLWVTAVLGTLLLGISLWGIAGAVVDTRQAKRLFPIFAAGGILGSVIGGVLTRPLARMIGAENLLLVWAGGLGAAFLLSRLVLGPSTASAVRRVARRRPSALRDMANAFVFVRRLRLLLWMTVAAVFFSILFYLLYLPYARAASERFPKADELAGFFGLFWAGVTLAAFLVSMLVTNRLFAWLGVAAMVIVLPLLYTAAFGALLLASGFVTLVVLRFVLGTWLQGVASPGWETLTNVVPESRRDQTRAFLNGGPTQVGTVIAGLVAIIGQNALTLHQFAAIGLAAAVLTVLATVGMRRSYAGALAEALRAGRPQVFERPLTRQAPIALVVDADSARVLSESIRSSDVRERRVAFQILAALPTESRPPAVVEGVHDDDAIVRLAAIRALDVSTPAGRDAVVRMIEDSDPTVAAAAAARALGFSDDDRPASRLRELLAYPDERVRRATIEQLSLAPHGWEARLAFEFLSDPAPEVRAAALHRIAEAAPDRALEPALAGLQDPDPGVRIAAGRALGSAGADRVEHVLKALEDPHTAEAAVEAVRKIELDGGGDRVRGFVRSAAARATRDRARAAMIPAEDDASGLLRDAILDRGRRIARSALWAATMLGTRREAMETAIQNLDGGSAQVATALETLETAGDPALVRPLLGLWEPVGPSASTNREWLSIALEDEDPFIRQCAEVIRSRREGGSMPGSVTALSVIERVLFLRKVSLFADLSPADLERVAQLVEERGYADGEVIAAEGEVGEELHIVIEGTIRVVQGGEGSERELARRATGDVVGEMSLIAQAPRIASLVADGPVRTIRLGRHEFESMLRERPGVALAVMRVLVQRLAEGAPPGSSGVVGGRDAATGK
jgi:HEAT repeat protein